MADGYPVLGTMPVIARAYVSDEPRATLEAVLDGRGRGKYAPATWDEAAYSNLFSKFSYATPEDNYIPQIILDVATEYVFEEYKYMHGAKQKSVFATTCNSESNPGYPYRCLSATEDEYRNEFGFDTYFEMIQNYEDVEPLWYAFLKKEMLSTKKIEAGDIRVIMCPPCDLKRLGATFDEEQNERMKERTLTHEAQVGWTPFHGNLELRLKLLTDHAKTVLEMDWTRYDGTIPRWLFVHIRSIRASMLDVDDRDLLEWYNQQLIYKTTLLANGSIVQIDAGNPSGQPSTSADNCMVNSWLTAAENAMWLHENGVPVSVEALRDHYRMICYGDDRLTAYHDNRVVQNLPSTEWLIEFYRRGFGMWVKPDKVVYHDGIDGASFCGMTFRHEGKRIVGVYNADKIIDSIVHPVKPAQNVEDLNAKLISASILCAFDGGTAEEVQRMRRKLENVVPVDFSPGTDFAKGVWLGKDQKSDRTMNRRDRRGRQAAERKGEEYDPQRVQKKKTPPKPEIVQILTRAPPPKPQRVPRKPAAPITRDGDEVVGEIFVGDIPGGNLPWSISKEVVINPRVMASKAKDARLGIVSAQYQDFKPVKVTLTLKPIAGSSAVTGCSAIITHLADPSDLRPPINFNDALKRTHAEAMIGRSASVSASGGWLKCDTTAHTATESMLGGLVVQQQGIAQSVLQGREFLGSIWRCYMTYHFQFRGFVIPDGTKLISTTEMGRGRLVKYQPDVGPTETRLEVTVPTTALRRLGASVPVGRGLRAGETNYVCEAATIITGLASPFAASLPPPWSWIAAAGLYLVRSVACSQTASASNADETTITYKVYDSLKAAAEDKPMPAQLDSTYVELETDKDGIDFQQVTYPSVVGGIVPVPIGGVWDYPTGDPPRGTLVRALFSIPQSGFGKAVLQESLYSFVNDEIQDKQVVLLPVASFKVTIVQDGTTPITLTDLQIKAMQLSAIQKVDSGVATNYWGIVVSAPYESILDSERRVRKAGFFQDGDGQWQCAIAQATGVATEVPLVTDGEAIFSSAFEIEEALQHRDMLRRRGMLAPWPEESEDDSQDLPPEWDASL